LRACKPISGDFSRIFWAQSAKVDHRGQGLETRQVLRGAFVVKSPFAAHRSSEAFNVVTDWCRTGVNATDGHGWPSGPGSLRGAAAQGRGEAHFLSPAGQSPLPAGRAGG